MHDAGTTSRHSNANTSECEVISHPDSLGFSTCLTTQPKAALQPSRRAVLGDSLVVGGASSQ